ncbi:MAG: leucyl-tRNA--protein transferase [Treponema sp.]|jgi:Leu/Phe-tRNA-protein transferase|nr:leucyl-tRNA--protein transferase [Treponema sp.]
MPYPLSVLGGAYVFLSPDDDCYKAALALEEYGFDDYCIGLDFESEFIARLMAAGFLVMSARDSNITILLPKHHLVRSCLFFPQLHIKKSIRGRLPQYELRFDTDFDAIVEKCIKVHGNDWLTLPLVKAIKDIRNNSSMPVYPASFGLYRNGGLKAGEFGIIAGKVYTSYSGYFEEGGAGTAQMILTAQFLEKNGFAFWDLGMPLDYKLTIGAREISRKEFMERFFSTGVRAENAKGI